MLIFYLQICDFASPIEKMPFGTVGTAGTPWPVTDIGSVCAIRDLRLESKPHHRVIFGCTKGFLSMFCRFIDILPPNFRFFGFPLKMGLLGPLEKNNHKNKNEKVKYLEK